MLLFSCEKWLRKYEGKLCGKRVVLFGATGGIGNALCRYILQLGGDLITVDRNPEKASRLREILKQQFPNRVIHSLYADLSDLQSVNDVCLEIVDLCADYVIHNAGAYSIPRKLCNTGLDNVFQINFASPYYITKQLLSHLAACKGKVIVVGSIAHNYSKTDPDDLDFKSRKQASLVYGNAKRFWMFSTWGLAEKNSEVQFAVTHPGITFTNITAHYPQWLFAIIKNPMKVIFMPPKQAALSIIMGMFETVPAGSWIGPKLFNVWGKPTVNRLNTAKPAEREFICNMAEQIYNQMQTSIQETS